MSGRARAVVARAGAIVLVAAIWIATAELGASSALLTHHPTHVWIPIGIALGIAVLAGEWIAIAVGLGSMVFLTAHHAPVGLVVLISLIDALEVALGAYLLAPDRALPDRARPRA